MDPLAAPAQQQHVLAPVLLAHHPKAFHAFGITHHFTAAQGEGILVVLVLLLVIGGAAALLRSN